MFFFFFFAKMIWFALLKSIFYDFIRNSSHCSLPTCIWQSHSLFQSYSNEQWSFNGWLKNTRTWCMMYEVWMCIPEWMAEMRTKPIGRWNELNQKLYHKLRITKNSSFNTIWAETRTHYNCIVLCIYVVWCGWVPMRFWNHSPKYQKH